MSPTRVTARGAALALLVAVASMLPNAVLADPPQTLWEELNAPYASSSTGAYDPIHHEMLVLVPMVGRTEMWTYDLDAPSHWHHELPYNSSVTIYADATWGMVWDPVRSRFATNWGVFISSTTPRTWNTVGATSNGGEPHTLVYDPFNDRLINVGNTVQRMNLNVMSPAWTNLSVSGSPPPARSETTVIYDTDHKRLILFGGGNRNDVWSLSLTGTPTWSQVFPSGTPPSARRAHVAVYDTRHRTMIMVGGKDAFNNELSDMYELFLTPGAEAWSGPINTTATDRHPVWSAAAAYDSLNDQLIVYPARYGGQSLISTVSLGGDPYTWTRRSPQTLDGPTYSPLPAGNVPCVYDALRHQFVAYVNQQLWALPLDGPVTEWQKLSTQTAGPMLGGHAMIYDPINDQLVTFAGWDQGVPGGYSNEIHTLSLAPPRVWGTITPTGSAPTPRAAPAGTYDPVGQRMVVFGGHGLLSYFNDAYGISLAGAPDWTPLPAASPPSGRGGARAIYDPVRHRMVIHGGEINNVATDETWALQLDGGPLAWTRLLPQGTAPAVFSVPVAYDPARDRMVVIPPTGDPVVLSFSSGTPAWSTLGVYGGRPNQTFQNMSVIYDPNGDRMVALTHETSMNPWSLRFAVREQLAVGPPRTDRSASLTIAAVHPNPARRAFDVELSLPSTGAAQADVFDIRGRRVFHEGVTPVGAGRQHVAVDLPAGLEPGVYFVRVEQAGKSAAARVAIIH